MGIPLPALTIKPPESTLSNLSDLLHAKSQMQGNQLQQQQIQGAQQENQLRALQIQDQQVLRTSAKGLDWAKSDTFDKWIANAQQNGVSPQTLSQLSLQRAQYKEQLSKTDKATLDSEQERNNQLLGHIDAIKAEKDPAKRAVIAQSQASQILSGGLVKDPQTTQMVQAIAQGQHVPTDDELQSFETGLVDHKTQVSQAIEKQKADAADWKSDPGTGALINVRTGEVKTVDGQISPALADSKYRNIVMAQQLRRPVSDEDKAFKTAYEKQKELNTVTRFQLNNSGGGLIPQGGGAGSGAPPTLDAVPASIRGTVKQIIDYRGAMPPSGRNNPTNQAIRYWVNQLEPTYDESSFPARNKILQSYTSGPESKSINAINTALGHLGELGEAAKALDQNDIPLLHSIASKLGSATGGSAATVYQGILHRVGPEMTAAYVQGGGGEGERGANQADFDIGKGAKQITDNIAESAKLLRSKIGAQEKQWTTTFKPTKDEDKFENRFITPAAKATLDEFSAKAPTGKGNAGPSKPAGATHTGVGSVDKKKHWLDASGKDLGLAE